MNFRSTKFALSLGAINGVIFYFVYQPVKVAFVKYLWYVKDDNYVYVALPEIYRITRDVGELFVWTLLFVLASYSAHCFWATKLKSTTNLWLRVAIISIVAPSLSLGLFHILISSLILIFKTFGVCFFLLNCSLPTETLLLGFIREPIDLKFELLLLVIALMVNFVYGTIIAKLSNLFSK